MRASFGGCYYILLGIAPVNRKGAAGARPISLTPAGVSTNEIPLHMIDDIIQGSTHGFTAKESRDGDITLFLDVVMFVGDHPAVSHTTDLLGHTANVPCHLCSFERYDSSRQSGTRYGYSSDIHSGHPNYARDEERTGVIRSSGLSKNNLKLMGMKLEDEHMPTHTALRTLGSRLEDERDNIPLTECGIPVVPARFDMYRPSVVAPDHLFLGLSQNVLNDVLQASPRAEERWGDLL